MFLQELVLLHPILYSPFLFINNIKNLFITEILKKNNYYITKLNRKGKIIFDIIENDPHLFSEKNLSYEDYILFMFTGYYTENILRSGYKKTKPKGGA